MTENAFATTYDQDAETPPPSQRRTLEVAVVATMAGLCDSRGNVPLDQCIPVPTGRRALPAIRHEEIYVLLYIDGHTSIEKISAETGLSITETVALVLGLLRQGLVELPA